MQGDDKDVQVTDNDVWCLCVLVLTDRRVQVASKGLCTLWTEKDGWVTDKGLCR